jgi:hypothetical protein
MAPPPDSPSIKIKVSWLKQNLAQGTSQPVLEFDEQQVSHFDPNVTTFKMVKHSCSYPAPPHKVRMWCSAFGAASELPLSMELNVFINTFELITEEKHTLAMVRLGRPRAVAVSRRPRLPPGAAAPLKTRRPCGSHLLRRAIRSPRSVATPPAHSTRRGFRPTGRPLAAAS